MSIGLEGSFVRGLGMPMRHRFPLTDISRGAVCFTGEKTAPMDQSFGIRVKPLSFLPTSAMLPAGPGLLAMALQFRQDFLGGQRKSSSMNGLCKEFGLGFVALNSGV